MEPRRLAVVSAMVLIAPVVAMENPIPVSPGGHSGVEVISDRCPTFLWTSTAQAESVDLVVYRLSRTKPEGPVEEVLSVHLPGSAQGWTPALANCLERGRRYAWAVRASTDEGPKEWSEASVIEILAGPSDTEVDHAVAVLQRYLETRQAESPGEGSDSRSRFTVRDISGVWPRPSEQRVAGQSTDGPPVGRFGPDLGAASLSVEEQVHLGEESAIFKEGRLFMWSDGRGVVALGEDALAGFGGSDNTAIGYKAMAENELGKHNIAIGAYAMWKNEEGDFNTAVGISTMAENMTGGGNTALGHGALQKFKNGDGNVGIGSSALGFTSGGTSNTAVGNGAMYRTEGSFNTAIGAGALDTDLGSYNTAVGHRAMDYNGDGDSNSAFGVEALLKKDWGAENTAMGARALVSLDRGERNVAVGVDAGAALLTGDDNIFLGSDGEESDSETVRIGREGIHTRTFLAGVFGQAIDSASAIGVQIDSSGNLGTVQSSRRYKTEIQNMGSASLGLQELRPVTFRYKAAPGNTVQQYGLVAEEVAEVFPELVVFDRAGRPETVKYGLLSSLLLNEVQKLQLRVRELEARGTRN